MWAELAGALSGRGDVTIAKVDCTVHKALCNEHGVKGYPTLLWFARGTRVSGMCVTLSGNNTDNTQQTRYAKR